jgi:ankyrin repeat protein
MSKLYTRNNREFVDKLMNTHGLSPSDVLYRITNTHNPEVFDYLIEKGADVTYAHNAALLTAMRSANLPTIKYLIERGADFQFGKRYFPRMSRYSAFDYSPLEKFFNE